MAAEQDPESPLHTKSTHQIYPLNLQVHLGQLSLGNKKHRLLWIGEQGEGHMEAGSRGWDTISPQTPTSPPPHVAHGLEEAQTRAAPWGEGVWIPNF